MQTRSYIETQLASSIASTTAIVERNQTSQSNEQTGKFTCFPKLPNELQLGIWKKSTPGEPRIITLDAQVLYLRWTTEPTWSEGPPNFEVTVRSPQMGFQNACYDSRAALLKSHPPLFPPGSKFPLVSANLDIDTIHLGPDFELDDVKAFASVIGPEKARQIRYLALEYEVSGVHTAGDVWKSWEKPGGCAWDIVCLFENLDKLIFIAHGTWNGSNQIKNKKLQIVPWRDEDGVRRGPDDENWAVTKPSGPWNEAAKSYLQACVFRRALSDFIMRGLRWDRLKPIPTIAFMELVGV